MIALPNAIAAVLVPFATLFTGPTWLSYGGHCVLRPVGVAE